MFEKKKKKIEGVEKEAKMSVLEGLRDMASSAMGDKLKGLKKVTVASDSPEGLKKGLEKAEELVEGKMSMMDMAKEHSMGSSEEESGSPEMEESEDESSGSDFESMSEDELDAALKKLMELKKQKSQE